MSVFIDTNVLVYARDANERRKQPLARRWMDRLWETGEGRLSTQVLNEYYVTVTRKLRPGMSRIDARADVTDLMTWRPLPITEALIAAAWTIEDRHALSFWDALIVAAAGASGAAHLLTEDLQDGRELHGVTVIDPFTNDLGQILGS